MTESFRSGYVAFIGRSNVGKSSLLNVVLGQKIAIVADRQQTTRNRILGIKNYPEAQIIFLDTPGIHKPRHALGSIMVRTAREVLSEMDLVVFVTEPDAVEKDGYIIESFEDLDRPVILLINKIDRIKKPEILSHIETYRNLFPFKEIIPVSAVKHDGIDRFLMKALEYLPYGPKYYSDDLVTDQMERFMVSEIIREKIVKSTSEEIPHCVAVEVINWTEKKDGLLVIEANIYVEREGQKGVIIGHRGKMLKLIGTMARLDIEKFLDAKIFLELRVKVKKGWRDDKKILNELGYR
ncbi:MAG: GTPase Era [Nitrospira bacterium HGW-Nitrospira-1]|nr:MAG: GTPase Era [Nitrospira bacterium HGW-Nitrospira-1]